MPIDKGRGILFGGVHDVEESEEGIDSEFFNALFAWNIERNRYFQMNLRKTQTAPKRAEERGLAKRDRGKADEAELLRNLAALETKGSVAGVEVEAAQAEPISPDICVKPLKPIASTMPHPRFNAQLAVQDDILYIFGGTYEHGVSTHVYPLHHHPFPLEQTYHILIFQNVQTVAF